MRVQRLRTDDHLCFHQSLSVTTTPTKDMKSVPTQHMMENPRSHLKQLLSSCFLTAHSWICQLSLSRPSPLQ